MVFEDYISFKYSPNSLMVVQLFPFDVFLLPEKKHLYTKKKHFAERLFTTNSKAGWSAFAPQEDLLILVLERL